jgi:EAL domain-containing protein (putative c-di-GMP-specific phosphodiesterase class I)
LELAVNVSALQLMRPGFCDAVAGVLVRTGMDPRALILEITENVLIEEDDGVIEALLGLRDRGIRLAIDDFGTGYSSLSHLRRLPVDIVKIDRTFVDDLGGPTVAARTARTGPQGGDPDRGRADTAREVVAAVTRLAHDLGLEVTAEGVETRFQRDEIVAIGCESAQGYFFARPMSADRIDEMLQARGTGLRLPMAEVASTVG